MSKKRNPLSGVTGVQAYEPDKRLRDKIGRDVDLRKDIFTPEQIAKTQQVINEAAADFFDETLKDVEAMHAECRQLEAGEGDAKALLSELAGRAQLIKGQAETLGFTLVAKVGASLCDYCRNQNDSDETAAIVVRKHVDTLRVAFHERLNGDGGDTGKELIVSLNRLIEKFSSHRRA